VVPFSRSRRRKDWCSCHEEVLVPNPAHMPRTGTPILCCCHWHCSPVSLPLEMYREKSLRGVRQRHGQKQEKLLCGWFSLRPSRSDRRQFLVIEHKQAMTRNVNEEPSKTRPPQPNRASIPGSVVNTLLHLCAHYCNSLSPLVSASRGPLFSLTIYNFLRYFFVYSHFLFPKIKKIREIKSHLHYLKQSCLRWWCSLLFA
jgi:hypothetical protein